MNCPVCGSEIPAGVKYCSVCGTDVEGAQLRAQQASAPSSPQPPAHGGAPQQPQGRAVPMNPSMPPQAAPGARGFDTSKMNGSPKWPIVLICVLVVVIVAVVLLIFHPWSQGGDSPMAEGPTTSNAETVTPVSTEGGEGDAGSVSETPQDATAAGLSDADAYTQLSAIYGQFAGFNDRIQGVVDYFNTYFPDGADATTLQAQLDSARTLQDELSAQTDALNAIQLADGSSYTETLANLKTLNNDLVQRTADLADALQAWVDGAGSDQVGAYLTRNNQNGASIYKTEYDNLYPNAAPQPVQ